MRLRRFFASFWTVLALIIAILSVDNALAQAAEPESTRRFALLVAANNGGQGRATLRYAATDARALGDVLVTMGGVRPGDRTLLVDPSPGELEHAIAQMGHKIARYREQNGRSEFVFYYSGHSDDRGLLLDEKRVGYASLRDRLNQLPADVRLIILDSCASGSFTRAKGGQRMPTFLSDRANQINGFAVLTSSSADEVAQESDGIQGSFFTHYLISGLRGAADVSGNRRVTLNEAYRYAFDETLARTHDSRGGAQHAEYDIQMSGHGELVLTAFQEDSAMLRLDEKLSGRIWVRDEDGRLIAEVPKYAGRALELGLAPGRYRVEWAAKNKVYAADVAITSGGIARVSRADFSEVDREDTIARGGAVVEESGLVAVGVDLVPWVGTSSVAPDAARIFSLNLVGGMSGGTRALEIGGAFNLDYGLVSGAQIGGAFNYSEGLAGVQIGGAMNLNRGPARGLQIGGALNTAESLYGAQIGGALNYSGGPVHGVQLGGALNLVTDTLHGLQFGAINITDGHVHGAQIGVINLAASSNASIGAVNIFWDGYVQGEIFGSGDGLAMAGIRHGSGAFYSVYHVGTRLFGDGDVPLAYGVGFGWRVGLSESIEFSADVSAEQVIIEPSVWRTDNLIKLRPMIAVQLTEILAIFGGPTLTVFIGDDTKSGSSVDAYAPVKSWQFTDDDSSVDVGLWPGVTAGVRFF